MIDKTMRNKLLLIGTIVSLGGIVVIVSLLDRNFDIRERAATTPIQCHAKKVMCSVGSDNLPTENYILNLYRTRIINGQPVEEIVQSGQSGETSIEFLGDPEAIGESYRCEVASTEDPTCTESVEKLNTCTRDGAVESCSCSDGELTCDATTIDEYTGDEGPGLIVLRPHYVQNTPPPDACFTCKELVLMVDGEEIRRFDCDITEEIRLHQGLDSDVNSCVNYSVGVIGENESEPQMCGECGGEVCCPACVAPVVVEDEQGPTCLYDCDYEILNPAHSCLASDNNTIEIACDEGDIFDFDDDYNPASHHQVCDNSGSITYEYSRRGVYDVAFFCFGDSLSDTSDIDTVPSEAICKKRITYGCGVDNPPTRSPTPSITITPSVTPTPTVCPVINVVQTQCIYE